MSPAEVFAPVKKLCDILDPDLIQDDDCDVLDVVDPEALCPWCDASMPTNPTKALLSLIRKAKHGSYKNPRPTNPLGLKAPFSLYLDVCARHEYETAELPKAAIRGWPKTIRFSHLPKRIEGMRQQLSVYVKNKSESVFWKELSQRIRKHGTLATLSLGQQFLTVEQQFHAG